MAITQVGTATTGKSSTSGALSVNAPSDLAEGHVIVAFGVGTEGDWTVPSGFTQLAVSTDGSTGSILRGYAWYKVCGPSEPSSYNFSNATATGNETPLVVALSAYAGVDTSDPVPHVAIESAGSVAEPANPTLTSFSQVGQGRLIFARMARVTSGTNGVSELPTFSVRPEHAGSWSEIADDADFSGGTVNYGLGVYHHNTDTGSGSRSEPGINCSRAEVGNVFILGCLKAAPDITGTAAAELPKLTSSFAGEREIPSGAMASALPKLSATFTAMGAPPEGSLATALPKLSAALTATSVGGGIVAELPSIQLDLAGAVNPIGDYALQLPSLSAEFVGETTVYGEHVIRVEREDRAFLVVDDGVTNTGLKPIKRSKVSEQ